MHNRDEGPPVGNESVFRLLYPGPLQKEEERLVACFCAMCAAHLAGESPVERIDTGLWIDFLEVRPYYRKRGYGRLLFSCLQAEYPRLLAFKVWRKSRPFWEKMGFTSNAPGAWWDEDWDWTREHRPGDGG